MKMKRSKVDELVRTTKALQNKNDKLTAELKKLNQSILVRKKIHDVVGEWGERVWGVEGVEGGEGD